jgi:hypothetical protein
MNERDLRRWANHFKFGGFQQYLLGNCPFEDCAIPVIEKLHEDDQGNVGDVIRKIDRVIKTLLADKPADLDINGLTEELEGCKESLATNFNIDLAPPTPLVPPQKMVLSHPVSPPKPVAPPRVVQPTKVEPTPDCDILSMMG